MISDVVLRRIKSLPPLPKSVTEVQRITSNPNSSIKDLINVIKEDPLMTANLLKVANSPLYGFSRKIKTIDQAIALFGMSTVKGFVISFAIRNTLKFDLSAYGIDENRFHEIALKRNALGINWYKKDREKLDIISTNSFLIDIGAVIISLVLVSERRAEEFREELKRENRYKVELKYIGGTTAEVTAEVFKHWRFSNDLVESMANIDMPSKSEKYFEYAAALKVLRSALDLLKDDANSKDRAIELIKKYNLDQASFIEAWNIVMEGGK